MINKRFKANRPRITGDTNVKSYWNVIEDIIAQSDILLEVLDARMPELSRNTEIEQLTKKANKKLIFILNKADLVSENELRTKQRKLQKINPTFIISSTEKLGTKRLRDYLNSIVSNYSKLKIGILGYPNIGKSSVINALAMKSKAKVTSKAGTTHGQQWISIGKNILIIDSPGVIPLKENDEIRHALIASKNIEKIKDLELVASKILELFKNKKTIGTFYKINLDTKNPEKIIELIAKKKGFIKKGETIDEERTAIQIIRDWQRGNLRL